MVDDALQRQIGEITFLLMLAVSLLSGLVFGRDAYAQMQVAVLSFLLLGAALGFHRRGPGSE